MLLTEKVEPASNKKCDCVIIAQYQAEPFVGYAQSFIHHVGLWAIGTKFVINAQQDQQATGIMDAVWFDVGGRNAGVVDLPVVKVDSWSEENGNHWLIV